jgi:hypothetical protein
MFFPMASAHDTLKRAEATLVYLNTLTANDYLAVAQKRWRRFSALDLSTPLTRLPAFARPRTAEAYRLRLAEAWRHAQQSLVKFEADLHAYVPSLKQYCLSVESFKAEVLTRYYAHILSYQAELGKQGRRQIPAEWMQLAAASALLSVLHTALLLWALQRTPRASRARARRVVVPPARTRGFAFVPAAPRALSLPLLC